MKHEFTLWLMAQDRQAELREEAEAERMLREAGFGPAGRLKGTLIAALGAVTLAVLLVAESAAANAGGGGGANPILFM
jgi:hypothetical protein